MTMNDTDRREAFNLAVANANLQISILKDDPPEILKALSHMEKAQALTMVIIYNMEQIAGLRAEAMLRMEQRKALYERAINANANQ